MFNGIRQRIRRVGSRAVEPARPRDARLQLRLPNPYGGKPWLSATLALTRTPYGSGETVRLRAHFDGRLRLPSGASRDRVIGHERSPRTLSRYGRDAAAAAVRGLIGRLPAERLQPLTARRWRSWLDIQFSTSPLDAGARALMPERLRGLYGDALPQAGVGEPRVGVWSGPAGGPLGGVAHLALLQFDERDLKRAPTFDRHAGFNLNASIAQLVEPASEDDGDAD